MYGNRGRGGSYNAFFNHGGGQAPDGDLNPELSEKFGRGRNLPARHRQNHSSSSSFVPPDMTLNLDIRKYAVAQESLRSTGTKDAWIDSSEIPKSNEIHLTSGPVNLPANKIDKPFRSVKQYLKTQYSLLREDAVSPLRDAIDTFKQSPEKNDDQNMSIYEKVHITAFTFTNMGIAARLKFSTKRAQRRILWSSSKRLVSGTLVALTPAADNFATKCVLAVIAARPLGLLEQTPPEVDVYFSCPEEIPIDAQQQFIMVEAKQGYYEAYRHTLRSLQKLSSESFVFSDHVTGIDTDISAPEYLINHPYRSLTPQSEPVNLIDEWPNLPSELSLDNSQWAALRQILTRKLAIVQGPPGTGKTHVSKIALEIMFQNRCEGDPPIIIAAQTNHALDQLLLHVSFFDPDYIRLGGRSTSTEVRKRALFEVRQKEKFPKLPGSLFIPAKKNLERAQAGLKHMLTVFDGSSKIVPDNILFEYGIISAAQQKSLIDAAKNWISSDEENHNPVQYWLGEALIPFEVVYSDENFGFEDAEDQDLEIEQLRETEAEHGLTDEEDIELLKGPWRDLHDDWTVNRPSVHDIDKAKRLLDIKEDLWDIPERMRGAVYWVMKQRTKDLIATKFRAAAKEYDRIVGELKIGKWERDAVYLKRANIIGMTTTGLSKYRPLIASLKPRIVLIEEAAEVIEGPIAAAFMESVEHVILVGDHQQLQGHCSVRELEDPPFNLAISMFERLVNLGMPFRTLLCQRRMIPEIRELVSPLYPELQDHESVITRPSPPAWGTGSVKSFFFHHDWSELKDESMSTYNEPEARMVAKFYRHLRRHGVPAPGITILTFYNGQRRQILRELKADPETNNAYNLVKTVDSYQGEENVIIILSLVRSNSEASMGFLNVENRVCVALSRARHGLYIFGNGDLLADNCQLWHTVRGVMEEAKPSRFGDALPLTCTQHNRISHVKYPDDFDQDEGGCGQLCGAQLPCGHNCPKRCHPTGHNGFRCTKECQKALWCGHPCKNKCSEDCSCNNHDCENSGRVGQEKRVIGFNHLTQHSTHLLDIFKSSRADTAFDNGNGSGSSTVQPQQSTMVRDSGSASSQPLKKSAFADFKQDFGHHLKGVASEEEEEEHDPASTDWNIFASGGVRKDDENRKQQNQPPPPGQGGFVDDLLDIGFTEDNLSSIKWSKEKNIGRDRNRYTQTYQPAVPPGFQSVSNLKGKERVVLEEIQVSCNSVPNLMD